MKIAALMIATAALLCLPAEAPAMIYHPATGAMWDPSVIWHNGKYHALMMYNRNGDIEHADSCLLAVSEDGVHWRDEAVVLEERERAQGCKFFKCMVARCGDRFILNHGVLRPQGQDTLRFYESQDLKNWTYLFSNHPDPRWYALPPQEARWDHMYMLPKQEGNPKAGYWGYPVSVAKAGEPRGVGMAQSPDGRAWEVLPPAKVEWGSMPPGDFEWGGCERIGKRCYLIGGGPYLGYRGYGMFTFSADDPRGPFRPDAEAYRLCGNSTQNIGWLAVWCRGNGELLVSNYASIEPGNLAPWLLPFRKPVVDEAGHLRLGWWKGNEALKGKPLALRQTTLSINGQGHAAGYAIAYLDTTFRPDHGLVLEGRIRATPVGDPAAITRPCAGFFFEEAPQQLMAILLGIGEPKGRQTRIGRLHTNPGATRFISMDVTGSHCSTVTGLRDDKEHTFRLLSRASLFELYIDDLLVQTFYYTPGPGRLGIVVRDAKATCDGLHAWEMSL